MVQSDEGLWIHSGAGWREGRIRPYLCRRVLAPAALNELSKIMGLPGKPEDIDGNEVERYFLEGRIKEIADYCETDVVNTYRVWLRYELFRGRLSESEHQASERCLADFVEGSR